MKLRKAMDKARADRQLGTDKKRSSRDREMPVDSGPVADVKQSYSQSTLVHLDDELLSENRCFAHFPDSPEADYFKVLRAQIQQRTRANGWNSIMITSAFPGEGKTLTSINLALSFARDYNQTVLLVDADLKKQRIHRYMGFESQFGLADYLLEDRDLADIVVWPGIDKLTIMSGGRTMSASTELLGSPKMKYLAQEMKNRYPDRYILFDVPPILGQADAIAFASEVDCILVVVESGKTAISDVKEAVKRLPSGKILGFVLNKHGDVDSTPY